ncbi:MAG: hypothetical protein HY270_14040 [Deltaproteobacteria bacterium]|nr:hypothetical protein [Deltaproteobacteria bacterium]
MKKSMIGMIAATFALVACRASAGTMFGALSNFDAVNDTGTPCNGFEIELDDIQSRDVTYTFQYQRYGAPKITEDSFVVGGVSHPRTFVRWMSSYDQTNHVFTQTTPVAPLGFKDTGGHLCFKNMTVNGQPYDTSGCEHFGVGTLKNPSNTVYRWMKEDPATPGSLIAQGNPVTIPAPVWSVNPAPNPAVNPAPVVAAVIPVPPPPAVVPVLYLPNAEFGVAVWAKVFETESPNKAELHRLVSDDEAVPGNLGPVPNANAVTEIAWQILQTDTMNPTANELTSSKQMGNGNESVTRRYEFYKYVGPYDVNSSNGPNTGTNEAICASVAADGLHGVGFNAGFNVDCSSLVVVGEYIGAQMAAADVATPLSANDANLVDGEVGVPYPDRPLIFGGSGGPYAIAFSGAGTLPATDLGNEFTLDSLTGVLKGGIPKGTGTSTFTVHATDLVEPAQPAVDATFNLTVVDAVAVDNIAIPDGVKNVATLANLTASGGATPFRWSAVSASVGLNASLVGNTLSLTANSAGTFNVQVTVDDSLRGTSTKTLTYNVPVVGAATATPTNSPLPTSTPTNSPQPTNTPTSTPVPTDTPTNTPPPTNTPTDTPLPTSTPTNSPPPTNSLTNTPLPTDTPTNIPVSTSTPTNTVVPTNTPSAGSLTLSLVGIRPAASASASNGTVALAGSLANAAAIDTSGGLVIRVQAGGLDQIRMFTAQDCRALGPIIECVSAGRTATARFGPTRTNRSRAFTASLDKLSITGPFSGPVTMTLTELQSGMSRSGAIATCHTMGRGLVCR